MNIVYAWTARQLSFGLHFGKQKTTSLTREETAHKANTVSSRVWLGDQCGHGCLQEVLDRRGNLAKAIGPLVRWAEQNQPTVDLNRVEYEKRERKRANLPL